MAERLVKWGLILLSAAWIAAAGWFVYQDRVDPATAALLEQRFEQRLNDCEGRFADRYECRSNLMRERSWNTAFLWTKRLGIVFGPPLILAFVFTLVWKARERQREVVRNRERLARKARQAEEARQQAIEEGRRQMEEARRKAEERKSPPEPTT